MLPKSQRFTTKDFTGKRPKVFFRSEYLDATLLLLPTQKFACVISKKTIRKAVDRNRVKRVIFEAIRTQSKENISEFSCVIYPKKTTPTLPYSVINEEIKKVFATLQKIDTR